MSKKSTAKLQDMSKNKDDKGDRYFCTMCGGNHLYESKKGQDHLKWAKGEGADEEDIETIFGTDETEDDDHGEEDEVNGARVDAEAKIPDEDAMLKKTVLSDLPGINEELEVKLKACGIRRPSDLASMDPSMLVEELKKAGIKGIGIKTAEKLVAGARKNCGQMSTDAKYMYEIYKKIKDPANVITSGSEQLDFLIGGESGGWILNTTVEIYGGGSTGKTELVLQAGVNAFLPSDMGGLVREDGSGKLFVPQVLIIDTEGTMTMAVSRLPAMCDHLSGILKHSKEEAEEFLEMVLTNIDIRECKSSAQQHSAAIQANNQMLTGEKNYTIVIVDSLVNNFRLDYSANLSELAPRQRALNKHIKTLKDIVILSRTPDGIGGILICTNQIQHKPVMFGDGIDNIGGNVVKHNLDVRLLLKERKGNLRHVQQVDSSFRPGGEAFFTINEWGIGSDSSASSVEALARR